MKQLGSLRLLAAPPILALSVSMGTARADEILCSSFPGGVVTGTVNAELIVDCDCTIAPGAFVNGNIEQNDGDAAWNITVQAGASVNGNIEDLGRGSVRMAIGSGQFFDNNVKEAGAGSVIIRVLDGGLYDGNVEETGAGRVDIRVQGSGLFNGNAYEKHGGDMSTSGTGMYNGSTKEEGPGVCTNTIENFNGSPCE
jgi:hypothetical protein